MINKELHFVWIGDETKAPRKCIQTWIDMNPSYKIRVWGNKELIEENWITKDLISHYFNKEICGAADLMRYEILYQHGGMTLDADTVCLSPLEDWVFETNLFASWENEFVRPGLITNAFIGAEARNPFLGQIITELRSAEIELDLPAWKAVGPSFFTDQILRKRPPITIYPSHFFTPEHFLKCQYRGSGKIFCTQMWESTKSQFKDDQ